MKTTKNSGLLFGVYQVGLAIRGQSETTSARNDIPPSAEFKFWLSATKASLLALFATTSRIFDVPVYWPILLMYFFILFGLTMRRQIQ